MDVKEPSLTGRVLDARGSVSLGTARPSYEGGWWLPEGGA